MSERDRYRKITSAGREYQTHGRMHLPAILQIGKNEGYKVRQPQGVFTTQWMLVRMMWMFARMIGSTRRYYPARMRKGSSNRFCLSLLLSVVSTKIARSEDIGIWATHKYNVSVNIVEKLASVCFESFDKAHECRKSWILRFVGHAYGHFPLCASMCPALPRMLELLYTTCLFYLKHNFSKVGLLLSCDGSPKRTKEIT